MGFVTQGDGKTLGGAFAWVDEVEEAERQAGGFQPIPRGTYFVKVREGKGGVASTGMPWVELATQVAEGPQGTVNRYVRDRFFLGVSEVDKDGHAKSADEKAKQEQAKARDLKRLMRVCGVTSKPGGMDDDSLTKWAGLFAGCEFVAEVRVEEREGYDPRNRIVWQSIAAPTDEEKAGKTALDVARERWAKQAVGKPGHVGAPAKPTNMFGNGGGA